MFSEDVMVSLLSAISSIKKIPIFFSLGFLPSPPVPHHHLGITSELSGLV